VTINAGFNFPNEISIEICSFISRSSKTTKERNKKKTGSVDVSHTHPKKKTPGHLRIREK
jgi:hypothetical protein